jgi:hypothetical protein
MCHRDATMSARAGKSAGPSTASGRRGSPDVVKKRRAARAFNELLGGSGAPKLDGRTEKRKQRMLEELKQGRARASKRELKPIDILSRVEQLLELGESIAVLRKAIKPPRSVEATPEVVAGLKKLHAAYGFRPETYAFVGIDDAALAKAGIKSNKVAKGLSATQAKDRARTVRSAA